MKSKLPEEIKRKIEEQYPVHNWMDVHQANDNLKAQSAAEFGYSLSFTPPPPGDINQEYEELGKDFTGEQMVTVILNAKHCFIENVYLDKATALRIAGSNISELLAVTTNVIGLPKRITTIEGG